ncbi:MAG: glycosyltransferase [bacterium]
MSSQLGFVGNLTRDVYHQRRHLLEEAERALGLTVTKTDSGTDYLHALNNIRFFLSADIGFDEYMVKNFEAMACGCLLIAYDHVTTENQALGLRDMENVVLYQDIAILTQKWQQLMSNPEMAATIATKGQKLAEERFKFETIGKQIVDEITVDGKVVPLHNQHSTSILDYFRYSFYR